MDTLLYYFPNLTQSQLKQFEALEQLYRFWNGQINVISRKDIDKLYIRHVLHSLSIAKIIAFKKGTKILDVGTGGGFPGIPLAILFPECQFYLLDSVAKKIKVVNAISQSLTLKNITTRLQRVETIEDYFDFIVSRAVTTMPQFLTWTANKISRNHKNEMPNGILYLKGGDLTQELFQIPDFQLFELSTIFNEDFFKTKKIVYIPL